MDLYKSKDMIKDKTPALTKARKALEAYLKDNNLSPLKDWTKDPIHGKQVTRLVNILNKERDKVAMEFPERDLDNERKLVKLSIMKKTKKVEEPEKKVSKKELTAKKTKEAQEKKKAERTTKYDYPLIDGREMNSAEKKKYRMEMRKKAADKGKPAKAKEEKKTKKEPVKEEKKPAKKLVKKTDKKVKKSKKEED